MSGLHLILIGLTLLILSRLPTSTIVIALGNVVFWECLWPRLSF